MKKNLYRLRLSLAIVIFIFVLTGFFGIIYPVKIFDVQLVPLVQRCVTDFSVIAASLLLGVVLITLVLGRIYCSTLCPFGILQEIGGLVKNRFKKSKCSKVASHPLKYFVAAIAWGILLGGSAVAIRYVEPYTLFGSAMSTALWGLVAVVLVVTAVFLKDRIFCTNFCPVGTVLGLISKVSYNKIHMKDGCVSCGMCEKSCPAGCIEAKEKKVDNETCIKCLKCISACPKGVMAYERKPKAEVKFNPKRREIILAGAAIALFAGMVKAGIELKEKVAEKIKEAILPPGAGNRGLLANKCLNCNLCVENCPNKIIQKADSEFNAVHIDFSKGFCKFDCNKCSGVCPSGAIKRISLEEKQKTRIAMAMINGEKCSKCGLCAEVCPTHAIIKEEGEIVFNALKCIGCGACRNACHFGAVEIYPVKEQKTI